MELGLTQTYPFHGRPLPSRTVVTRLRPFYLHLQLLARPGEAFPRTRPRTNTAVAAPASAMIPCAAKLRCNAEVATPAGRMLEPTVVPPSAVTRSVSSATSSARPIEPPSC